ncbi:MAG: hypothetical protein ACLR17_24645 [Enterobacteriaceae bacterium]
MASVASGVTWFVLYESGRRAEITVVAINELADAGIAHLLKYDTSHGPLPGMYVRREQLFVGDDAIRLLRIFP